MTTAAQVEANRANAQKSTGPRTPEGKATVAQNAVKHGLLARTAVLHGEDWEEHACFSEDLLNELYPDGVMEQELADRIVSLSWRLRRAMLNQNAIFEALYDKYVAAHGDEPVPEPDPAEGRPFDGAPLLGRMLVADFSGERVLERMLMYERRIESSLYRTTAEFRKLRAERKAGGCISRPSGRPSIPDDHPIWGRSPARGPQPAWEPGRGGNPPGADRLQEILDEAAQMAAWAGDSDATDLPQGQEQLCQTNPISGVGTKMLEVPELSRQTKPNCLGKPGCGSVVRAAERPIFAVGAAGAV